MSLLHKLLALFSPARPFPEDAAPPSEGHNRVHLFAGRFGSELAATQYVFDAPDKNHPEPFTNDLPEAMIDTNYVEIAFGERLDMSLELIAGDRAEDLRLELGDADTLLIVSEQAFGGLPYALDDTPRAAYLGAFEVRI